MTAPESASAHKKSETLHRSLGLYAVLTISIGAMIGSGIFVLPGLAFKIAGPSVVLAFFLAGVVVLPAALSKAEMATAMPEAGGTYLYIDRAMGPLMGTVAGFGVWFSLVFKASFALVGLSAYLEYFVSHPERPVAALLAVAAHRRQSARCEADGEVPDGACDRRDPRPAGVRRNRHTAHPVLLVRSAHDLAESRGFCRQRPSCSCPTPGVTKVASIAEEVRRPGRNIPVGMLVSIGFMMLLYPAIVAVIVGVSPAG